MNAKNQPIVASKAGNNSTSTLKLLRFSLALLFLTFAACAHDNCDHRGRGHWVRDDGPALRHFDGDGEQRGAESGGGHMNMVSAYKVHIDHQSREIPEDEKRSFFLEQLRSGATRDQVQVAFREKFESPRAKITFQQWNPRDAEGIPAAGSSSSADVRE